MDLPLTSGESRRRGRWLIPAAGIGVLVAVALGARLLHAPTVPRSEVWIGTVRKGTFRIGVSAHGVLEPASSLWLAAPGPAVVKRILAPPGTRVRPGSEVVELANPELESALAEAELRLRAERATLTEAKARVERDRFDQEAAVARAESALEKAKIDLEADQELRDRGLVPDITLRKARLDVAQFERDLELERKRLEVVGRTGAARLRELQARVRELESAAVRARARVTALHVRAGITGVVQRVLVEPGQRVAAGAHLARVAGGGAMVARLKIAQRDAARVARGQRVELDVAGTKVKGHVTRVDPTVVGGFVEVEAALPARLPAGARPDLAVEGDIVLTEVPDALYVELPAGATAGGELQLYRLDRVGRGAERVRVRLGRLSARYAEVVAGLKPGDRVIVSEPGPWKNVRRIRLAER
ncbi:MAG: HlyD family efflux transporter periplasmic adaptor subunit [Acidobacteria bacterium]|nr:HlyD family efflux transporter periplasmic adaptor subunit [Acidobacteriota bacterium]